MGMRVARPQSVCTLKGIQEVEERNMKIRLPRVLAFARRYPIRSFGLVVALVLLGLGIYQSGLHFYSEHHLHEAERATACYDFDEAERHLAVCLWASPRRAALHFQMARVARRANHYDLAEEHLRKCRELEGKNPENALESLLLRAQSGEVAEVENLLLEEVANGSPDANLILEAL